MSRQKPRYSDEEIARRGDEIYETQIKGKVEEGNRGRIVAIDIETSAYEVGDTVRGTSHCLLAKYPDAEIWFLRVGHRALHRIGAYPTLETV